MTLDPKRTPTRISQFFSRETGAFFCHALCIGLFAMLAAAPAFAQESGGDITASHSGVIFRWINFAIVFALIAWGVKSAAPHFRKQSEEISRKIAEGARAREAADQQRLAAQEKLAGISDEIARIRAEAKRSGDAEAVRLRALARAEAEMIAKAALAEIEAAQRAARLELKTLAGRLAVDRAEALLQQQITPSAQAALFEAFVSDLQGSAN